MLKYSDVIPSVHFNSFIITTLGAGGRASVAVRHAETPPQVPWSASTHRSPSGRKQKATTAGPRRLTTASSSLHRVTDATLRPLVVLFGRLRSRRLLLLKAAPEEGQHRGHQVVSTLGGGDVVSFIWENLGGEKEKS